MLFNPLKTMAEGLEKTRKSIMAGVGEALRGFSKIDDELFDELEEALIAADMGVETSVTLIGLIRKRAAGERITDVSEVKRLLAEEIAKMLGGEEERFALATPAVMLVVGVNGVGKTTTAGKLAAMYKETGMSVLLAAADTFRAAAAEQLDIWGERSGVPVIKHGEGADPGAVVFDALQAAKARKTDLLIVDTAGRLHNKKNLMDELGKLYRIIAQNYAEAQLETLLVLDAATGQNAVSQAKLFKEAANITGIALTKLDGTAKGGVVVAIRNELGVPVRFAGIGEKTEDLRLFDASEFAGALFD